MDSWNHRLDWCALVRVIRAQGRNMHGQSATAIITDPKSKHTAQFKATINPWGHHFFRLLAPPMEELPVLQIGLPIRGAIKKSYEPQHYRVPQDLIHFFRVQWGVFMNATGGVLCLKHLWQVRGRLHS